METAKVLADLATALATVVLAFAAWLQLPAISKQMRLLADQIKLSREAEANNERRIREWETLKACERYDFDPVLEAASIRIWEASEQGTNYVNGKVNPRDAIVILNYLDGLATGIEQHLYIEAVIKDHLGGIFEYSYKAFIETRLVDTVHLEKFCEIHHRWFSQAKPIAYQSP